MRLSNCTILIVKAGIRGGVEYTRVEPRVEVQGVLEKSEWEVKKTVFDVDERKQAINLVERLKRSMRNLGLVTDLGIVMPFAKMPEWQALHKANRALATEWNSAARYTTVQYYCIAHVIASDAEAGRYVRDVVKQSLAAIREAIVAGDVERTKMAFKELRGLDLVVREENREQVQQSLELARKCVRDMRKALKKLKESDPDATLGEDETRGGIVARIEGALFGETKSGENEQPDQDVDLTRFDTALYAEESSNV